MTPISEGLYEFKNDSLVEIRKRMGISQSKMAELLGVPANTLSRWETGNTVPDASVLASVYSFAKAQGISDIPLFFGVRKNPLEVKIGSKPLEDAADADIFHRLIKKYLNTQIELIGTAIEPVIKIEISNTAPESSDLPKIVFTGVGLSIAHIGGETNFIRRSQLKTRINKISGGKPAAIASTPWQNDSKIEDLMKTNFTHVNTYEDFPEITSDEQSHGEVLFPGQAITYEIDVPSTTIPYLQFKVEGNVSRRHLSHGQEIFTMPENITKPLAINAISDLNRLDISVPLENVIQAIPKFDKDTRLEDVQKLSNIVLAEMTQIKTIHEKISELFRKHKMNWFQTHLRAAYIYLDRVNAVFARLNDAIRSNSPDRITIEVTAVLALKEESIMLKRETEELLRKKNISMDELGK